MHLLDSGRDGGGHYQRVIHQVSKLAPVPAQQAQGAHSQRLRAGHRPNDIGAIATGADANEQVPRAPQGLQLAGKDLVETIVVANGGEGRSVRGERDSRQGPALLQVAATQFGGQMLGVRGAAPVAADQDPTSSAEPFGHIFRLSQQVVHFQVEKGLFQLQRRLDMLEEGLLHGGDCDTNFPPGNGRTLADCGESCLSFGVGPMDWITLNHAFLAHLPVALGLLLPWALFAAQRPGRGIRPWWTVARYLGWLGLLGLLAAWLSGLSEAWRLGLLPPHRVFPPIAHTGTQALLFRHGALGWACLLAAGFALWSMNRPRKDHQSLGLLALFLGLLWAVLLLMTGRQGFLLAHGVRTPSLPAVPKPVVAAAAVLPEVSDTVSARILDYAALEPLQAEPVKSPAHGGRWIRVWASPEAAPVYRLGQPLPVGALVVMSSQEDRWGRPGPDPGPLYALEQTAKGPELSFYWSRVPTEQRQAVGGVPRAYWHDEDPKLEACRTCHAHGLADPARRSRWRAPRLTAPKAPGPEN